jgi:hypothetical protein
MRIRSTAVVAGLMILLAASTVLLVPAFAQAQKLELMIWDTDELDTDALFKIASQFTRDTYIGIQILSVPLRNYRSELADRLMTGTPPDLFWATDEMLREFAKRQLIIPLDDAIERAPGLLVLRSYRLEGRQYGLPVGPSAPFSDIAYAVSERAQPKIESAMQFIEYLHARWSVICCVHIVQPNPPLNSAIAAHGNTDWHIDTANEFLFGTDMHGASTAANHCPNTWTRQHIHTDLTNTNHFYYDSDRATPGDDTDATNGIDTAMLFFYAGHGFPPSSWSTLGNSASVSKVSIADDPGWGMLRYYWQCSCTVFAHGQACCPGDTCSATHPCPDDADWWYRCPGQFSGAADSLATPNVYERWGAAINPNLRMACGTSTCGYCHEGQMNSIWNNYNNLGYDVADSFIEGLHVGNVVPLCITMGGYNASLTPLVTDTTFTNLPNTSGTSHYHIQYLQNFSSSPIGGSFVGKLPDLLAKRVLVRPGPIPELWMEDEYRIDEEWMTTPDQIEGRGPRARINRQSGAMYAAGPAQPLGAPPILSEGAYLDRAFRHLSSLHWQEEYVSGPTGVRMMVASVPVEKPVEQEHSQKNVIVSFRRQIDVEGVLVPVLGEGGVMDVQMNNDGTLLNASKVWRQVVGFERWEPIRPYDQALAEALERTGAPDRYGLSDWAWGYVEEAGNVRQSVLELVYRFWFVPTDSKALPDLAPIMVEIPA